MLAVDEESQLRRGPAGETAADDVAYHVMIRQLAISNHGFAVLMAYSLHSLHTPYEKVEDFDRTLS